MLITERDLAFMLRQLPDRVMADALGVARRAVDSCAPEACVPIMNTVPVVYVLTVDAAASSEGRFVHQVQVFPPLRGMLPFAPGSRVFIRDEEQLIRRVDLASDGGWLLTWDGISEFVRGRSALFLTELEDRIEVLESAATALVPDTRSTCTWTSTGPIRLR